ncbi:hypothetical protein WMY93_020015 [Mugilogobius chulae]|uniref:Uncharacterized protein n=1 Tax=Mugilogobius chulae TaxID=88201 RepID=A0AAW0NRW8_9GOBI
MVPHRPSTETKELSTSLMLGIQAGAGVVSWTDLSNWPHLGTSFKRHVTTSNVTSDEGGSPATETVRPSLVLVLERS